eukprot:9222437-Pyramimonas_sp.AAC.1
MSGSSCDLRSIQAIGAILSCGGVLNTASSALEPRACLGHLSTAPISIMNQVPAEVARRWLIEDALDVVEPTTLCS